MNELREQFEKKTGIKHKEVHLMEQRVQCFNDSYVEWLEYKLNNNEVLDLVSCFSAEKVEKAYYDGTEAERQRCDSFDIKNYS